MEWSQVCIGVICSLSLSRCKEWVVDVLFDGIEGRMKEKEGKMEKTSAR